MKITNRTLTIIFLTLVCLSILISCSAENAKTGAASETGSVVFFGNSASRDLIDSYDYKSFDNLSWFYTAKMTGDNGAEINKLVPIKDAQNATIIGTSVGGFSQGEWEITVYGLSGTYAVTESGSTGLTKEGIERESSLVYEGTGTTEVVAGTSVDITVALKAMGTTGKLQLGNFTFEYKCNETVDDTPTVKIEIKNTAEDVIHKLDAQEKGKDPTNLNKRTLKINCMDLSTADETVSLPVGTYTFTVTSAQNQNNDTTYIVEGDTSGTFAIYGDCVTSLTGDINTTVNEITLDANGGIFSGNSKYFVVDWDGNVSGGSGSTIKRYASSGTTYTPPTNLAMQKPGFTNGTSWTWLTDPDDPESNYTAATLTSDLHLYAPWEYIEYEILGDGPAGGYIVYDKGEASDGWRYLEGNKTLYKTTFGFSSPAVINKSTEEDGKANSKKLIEGMIGKTYKDEKCTQLYDEKTESYAVLEMVKLNNNSTNFKDWYIPSLNELDNIDVNATQNNPWPDTYTILSSCTSDDGENIFGAVFNGYNRWITDRETKRDLIFVRRF